MAHEMGHYVLHHVVLGLLAGFGGTLVALYLVHPASPRRCCGVFPTDSALRQPFRHCLAAAVGLAAQAIVLLLMPLGLAFSRHLEHAADRFAPPWT